MLCSCNVYIVWLLQSIFTKDTATRSPDLIILMYKHLCVTVCCIMWKLCDGKLYSVNLCFIGVQ